MLVPLLEPLLSTPYALFGHSMARLSRSNGPRIRRRFLPAPAAPVSYLRAARPLPNFAAASGISTSANSSSDPPALWRHPQP